MTDESVRSSKQQGYHDIFWIVNAKGEWSPRIEPEGIQIDNHHPGGVPHLHLPGRYEEPLNLPHLTWEEARRRIYRVVGKDDPVDLEDLLRELLKP